LRPQQNELVPPLLDVVLPLDAPLLDAPLLDAPLLDAPLLDAPLEPPLLVPPLVPLHATATKDMETRAMTTWVRMGRYLAGLKG
jgi:hypothetical protein